MKYRVSILFFSALILIAGVVSYFQLGRLEDPTFTIKMSMVAALAPDMDAHEAHEKVAKPITESLLGMEDVNDVRSRCEPGLCLLYTDIKFDRKEKDLPMIHTKIRQRMQDLVKTLPPGVQIIVQDDFTDVYGQFYALTGDGYTLKELNDQAEKLKTHILKINQVASVNIVGNAQPTTYLNFNPSKLANSPVPADLIFVQLASENLPSGDATAHSGDRILRVAPNQYVDDLDGLKNLPLGGGPFPVIKLKDVASVEQKDASPRLAFFHNNQPAIGLGISTVPGGNSVVMGQQVEKLLNSLKDTLPPGMRIEPVYLQSKEVVNAVDSFILNVIESVVIVIAVLLIFMGIRTGLVVGIVLVLILAATLACMNIMGVFLQIVSLGSMILALGMLVDNTIVISEGLLVGLEQHHPWGETVSSTLKSNTLPLLGGTLIAITGFIPIGLNSSMSGEYCLSLFQVVGLSLLWSWVLALTTAPALSSLMLKAPPQKKDPYNRPLFRAYRKALVFCCHRPKTTLLVTVGLFALAVIGFFWIPITFFPSSASPYFTIDLWSPQGTSAEEHQQKSLKMASWLLNRDDVKGVTTSAGSGGMRFILTIDPQLPNPSYSQLLVKTESTKAPAKVMAEAQAYIEQQGSSLEGICKPFSKGGGFVPKIEARFTGPDSDVLRDLAQQAAQILRTEKGSKFVRLDWRDKVLALHPVIDRTALSQAGVSPSSLHRSLNMALSGMLVGIFNGEKALTPLVAKFEGVAATPQTLSSIPIYAPAMLKSVPLGSLLSSVDAQWEDPFVWARDGELTVTAQCELEDENGAAAFLRKVKPLIEQLPRPDSVQLSWGGEHETSAMARDDVLRLFPWAILAIFAITVFLFNSLRQPIIIFLCIPLIMIGVTPGLLIFRQPFSFLALLGFISLMGMLVKNSIVLLDQIESQLQNNLHPFDVIINSGVSRLRPVSLSAVTTVLGMIPLVRDRLFAPLAVTIMCGLSVATVLTLIVVPVLCMIFYRVQPYEES